MIDTEFADAQKAYEEAKARLDAIVIARARAIYEHYDNYAYDDDGEGGWMTQKECQKDAIKTLQEGKTVSEVLDEREANMRYMRSTYIPFRIEQYIRNAQFHFRKTRDDIAEEALRDYLSVITTAPAVTEPNSDNGTVRAVGLTKATDTMLRENSHRLGCTMGRLIVAALKEYFVKHPPKYFR